MLESGVSLEEVVVVGYGSQKKASVVGAISTADAKELQSTGTTNLTQAIGGRIAGVISRSPGGRPGDDDASVYIRGIVQKEFELCFSSFDFVEKGFNFLQYALIRAYWRKIIDFFIRKRLVAPSLVLLEVFHQTHVTSWDRE